MKGIIFIVTLTMTTATFTFCKGLVYGNRFPNPYIILESKFLKVIIYSAVAFVFVNVFDIFAHPVFYGILYSVIYEIVSLIVGVKES